MGTLFALANDCSPVGRFVLLLYGEQIDEVNLRSWPGAVIGILRGDEDNCREYSVLRNQVVAWYFLNCPVDHADVELQILIHARAKSFYETDCNNKSAWASGVQKIQPVAPLKGRHKRKRPVVPS
jgi:hypothetical protein